MTSRVRIFKWFKSDSLNIHRPLLVIYHRGEPIFIIRFGIEQNPLFSERNPRRVPYEWRWRYLFGKRISWRRK